MHRSHPSPLEVDEFHFPRRCEHDVPSLEVTVQEILRTAHQQPAAQSPEVLLEGHLVEFQSGWLQKAVFEVVEIEHDRCPVETHDRPALMEIQSLRPDVLEGRQGLHSCQQQCLLLSGIAPAPAPGGHRVEECHVPQVLLQVDHPVLAYGQYLRHGKSQAGEIPVQIEERLILLKTGPGCGDAAASVPDYPEILTVAPGRGQGGDTVLSCTGISLEE